MAGRFIKLYDKLLKWEWYKNTNTKVLFIHLLLRANYTDASFEGHKVLRGQLVTSLSSLASETGLTVRQVRVSLEHLMMTGEVASKAYPRYRVITIVHYDEYQSDGRQNGSQMTGETSVKRQANDRLMTGKRQADDRLMTVGTAPSIEYIERVEEIERIEKTEESERKTAKRFVPPSREELSSFCQENGLSIDVDRFLNHYESNGWMVGRNKMKDWRATARNWSKKDNTMSPAMRQTKTVAAQQYEQRDYGNVQDQIQADMDREIEEYLRKNGGGNV